MQILRVSLVQTNLYWENKTANFNHIQNLLHGCANPDLIVLPEMFTTGFSMNPQQFAHDEGKEVINKLTEWSKLHNSAVCGSAMVKQNAQYFNRFFCVNQHLIAQYDKAHLFRMGQEQQHYTKGKLRTTFKLNDWIIAPFICYDLRFPVWIKRTPDFNYHVLVFVANWPERRKQHWITLLQARAIENQCFVIGVNRVGTDGNGIYHSGNSMCISATGEVLWHSEHHEMVHTVELNLTELLQYRKSFPVELDDDAFIIT
jgi:predicted amidohydrolase